MRHFQTDGHLISVPARRLPGPMSQRNALSHRCLRAFTLVELLAVIAIIALLLGILLPTVSRARVSANRIACRAQLKDLGAEFSIYLNDSKNILPRVEPTPASPLFTGCPTIVQLLAPIHRGATGVFRCPSDQLINTTAPNPTNATTYFDRDGMSYLYNDALNPPNFPALSTDTWSWTSALNSIQTMGFGHLTPDKIFILKDEQPFHAKAGANGSTNYLFADMHVDDFGQ